MDTLDKMNKAYEELKDYASYKDALEKAAWDMEWLVRAVFSFGWQQGEASAREEMQESQGFRGS